jgi:hypothetical protein
MRSPGRQRSVVAGQWAGRRLASLSVALLLMAAARIADF